jgi:hypothetical protein
MAAMALTVVVVVREVDPLEWTVSSYRSCVLALVVAAESPSQ